MGVDRRLAAFKLVDSHEQLGEDGLVHQAAHFGVSCDVRGVAILDELKRLVEGLEDALGFLS